MKGNSLVRITDAFAAYVTDNESEYTSTFDPAVQAIEEEWAAHGSSEDKRQLAHVLHEPASALEGLTSDGEFVEGRAGQLLQYFVTHPTSVKAGLSAAEVVALRLYTSSAYKAINAPLRDKARTTPHPFAATVVFLTQGIEKLRAVHAPGADASSLPRPRRLWRGLQNVQLENRLERMRDGGTELAPA